MRYLKSVIIAVLVLTFMSVGNELKAQSAEEIVDQVIERMGGLDQLKELGYIRTTHIGHKHWIEQSENPNGPFITSYERAEEIRSLDRKKIHQKLSVTQFQFKEPIESEITISEEKGGMRFGEMEYPMPESYSGEFLEWIRYDPVSLILAAKESPENVLREEVNIDDIPHYVLDFEDEKKSIRLFVSKETSLISEAVLETVLTNDQFYSLWGTFNTTVKYSLYHYLKDGIRYPMQWDIYRRDHKWKSSTIIDIEFNPEVGDSLFILENEITKTGPVTEQKGDLSNVKNIADGVYILPGSWFVSWVVLEDGIYVIEAPISSSYSESVITHLRKEYPELPIKAVINASDAHPHIAGLRPYAALQIPIVTSHKNTDLLEQLFEADYSHVPDRLKMNPVQPNLMAINPALMLNNDIEIYPVNGEGGARMLAVYLPKLKLLYAADLIQKTGKDSFFMPQYVSEVKSLVENNNLEVEKVFALHTPPLKWDDVLSFLSSFEMK